MRRFKNEETMNKIAVNPTQFITCRLCLEELGNYQIVPSVNEQIAYCFGFKVEPFDGLPQLICQKCEEILSNYSKIKKKYIENQEELKGKVYDTERRFGKLPGAQQVIESQENFINGSNKENVSIPAKRKPCISSASSDLGYSRTCNNTSKTNKSYSKDRDYDAKWPASYKKQFVCRICNSHWSHIQILRNHISKRHGALCKKYGYILKRNCRVALYKCDGKANITGSRSKVVHSKEKIVKNVNAEYHIIYTSKDYKGDKYNAKHVEARKTKSENEVTKKFYSSSSSSDEDIVIKHKRKRRLYSSSSNETVLLDSKPNASDSDNKEWQKSGKLQSPEDCINLDDSSETELVKKPKPNLLKRRLPGKKSSKKLKGDLKTVQSTIEETIAACRIKHLKRRFQDSIRNPSDIANKLQHKIFSIGRKIINKRIGVNCTPLLRFMEHKNLDIVWLPREIINVCQDSNYIRINPRRKTLEEKFEDNETGWTDYVATTTTTPIFTTTTPPLVASISSKGITTLTHTTTTKKPMEQAHSDSNAHVGYIMSEALSMCMSDSAVISDANLVSIDTKKLLNSNPVANPKQLPKKCSTNEVKMAIMITEPAEIAPQEDNAPDLYMPIITSTTSLAAPFSIQDDNDHPCKRSENAITRSDQQQGGPRIKIKPMSELMSVETFSRMQNPVPPMQNSLHMPAVTHVGKGLPLPVQNVTVPVIVSPQNMLQSDSYTTTLIAPAPAWQSEFMILDTIELPNTKTNSPYLYFKKLLQIHNITLIDTHVELPGEFHCLIKFKVQYKQDVQNQPVQLCLALFCSKNVFCFKVKDRNNENLDVTKISPNWQWEVLKIYKAEVVNKLLHNAQKIGQDVFEFTNSFLCLLKSINIKRMS